MMMQVTIYAKLTKKLCVEEIDNLSLSSLMASRLLPLSKNPGLRPMQQYMQCEECVNLKTQTLLLLLLLLLLFF